MLLELDGAGSDGAGRRVLFSGDLGHYDQPIIRDPVAPPACDYMLVESTYGDRLHDPEDPKVALARVVNEAAERGGPLLIPAFAVGRTQELLYHLRELEDEGRIPILPVRVDSPMAAAATQIYSRNRDEHDEEYASVIEQNRHPLRTRSMLTASSREESKRLNEEKGSAHHHLGLGDDDRRARAAPRAAYAARRARDRALRRLSGRGHHGAEGFRRRRASSAS